MSYEYYPITGIPVQPGEQAPARRELASWSTSTVPEDQIQVSLFIRALQKMQDKNPLEELLSYFQIAGIHGYPVVPWDHSGQHGFYCTHGSITFPTWHRPYMLLYEQVLYNIMDQELIPGITDTAVRQDWKKAAQQWRLPFWDWAIPQADTNKFGVPGIVGREQLEILKLGGKDKESVKNPLYKYTNKIGGEEVSMNDPKMKPYQLDYDAYGGIYNKSIGTSRYGNPSLPDWVQGFVDNAKIEEAMENPEAPNWQKGVSIAENVYRILTDVYFQSYETFSSTYLTHDKKNLKPTEYLSLEMIHNNIHVWTGGWVEGPVTKVTGVPVTAGHMADVPVASFDPIFWLHHCNVDRLLAIWQYLNPDKWFGTEPPPTPGHTDITPLPTDDLPPFHINKQGKYYNSNDARDCEKLGYTYQDLVNTDIDKLKAELLAKYGKHTKELLRPIKGIPVPGIGETTFPDYIINVEYDRFALGGEPYAVKFHLETTNDRGQTESCTLGSFHNFTSPVVPDCKNCQEQKDKSAKSKAQVPITLPLHGLVKSTRYPDATSLEPDHVDVLLEQQLKISVTKLTGEQVPLTNLPGFHVTVHVGTANQSRVSRDVFQPETYHPLRTVR
ncbi:tyrosinase [Metarhizium robertsii ARSEF 23]|uniref:tyrosinase n=1 Tax=Metarhizium robertsii (strain ARSEF 23 / ATCC MYA-3075) TaxID=655844 RepID=E9F624_METRA|nr:tyrosinase [Metarhizium robertsii ARSEF 23]EFY96910.2 tyrosinase [Metarhizium robertsii ARSEF 23]